MLFGIGGEGIRPMRHWLYTEEVFALGNVYMEANGAKCLQLATDPS